MITAVFDCMVYLQAATNRSGPAFACLALAEANEVTLYVSPGILSEVRDVLNRPRIPAKFPHLTRQRIDVFLQKLATVAVLVSEIPDAGLSLRDPDDLPYLNLAIAANTGYIVTRDKDLLDLMNDRLFLAKCPHLHILDPAAFLKIARSG